ncbi:MAG: hypothetical protein JWN56_1886 [Sphingobacteriales bacterium]|nr:hypothetical protein [Sphingobacteriales bacterium]
MKKLLATAFLFAVIGSSCKKEEGVKPEIKKETVSIEIKPKEQQTYD